MKLKRQLNAVRRSIRAEQDRLAPDDARLGLLKRLRLSLKDALAARPKTATADTFARPEPAAEEPEAPAILSDTVVIEGLAAACAMIAYADGSITPAERGSMLERLEGVSGLGKLDTEDFLQAFEAAEQAYDIDGYAAQRSAEAKVGKLAAEPGVAVIVAHTAAGLAIADGTLAPEEHQAVRRLFCLSGLDPEAADAALAQA